jgi:hypothetical protein
MKTPTLKRKKGQEDAAAGEVLADGAAPGSAPAASGFKLPAGRGRRGRSYGVDIDGNVVRVVELLDNAVVSYGTYQGHSVEDAFRKFLATKPNGDVTVAWMGPNMHVVRTPIPNVPPAALRVGVLDAIDESLPLAPGSASIAARIFQGPDGVAQAAVTAIERESVASLWNVIGSATVGLVPAPLLFINDGLFLGVRYSDAQLMLVANGAILASRPLAIGGLTTMFDRLGGDPTRAAERFATVARGGTRLDPDAAAVVDSYSGSIGDEVRRTVDFWARQGHAVPSEVYVHGPGIVLPNLSGKLLDAALFARPVALPEIAVDAIARTERPTAYLALLAAILDGDAQPIADLADPRFADRARKKKEALKRTVKLVGGVGVAVVGVLAFILPYGWAKGRNYLAQRDLATAQKEFDSYGPELALKAQTDAGVAAYNDATLNEVAWNELFTALLSTAPDEKNPKWSAIAVTREKDQLNVAVSASQDGNSLSDVASWVSAFERQGAKDPLPSSSQVLVGPPSRISVTFRVPILMDPKDPITGRYLAGRTLTIEKPAGTAEPAAPATKGSATTVKGSATTVKGSATTVKGSAATAKGSATTVKGSAATAKGSATTVKGSAATAKGSATSTTTAGGN